MAEGELGVRDLALAALAPQLPRRLNDQEDAVRAGVGVGEATACGVHWEVASGGGALASQEIDGFAPAAEPKALQGQQDCIGKGVVDQGQVKVAVGHAGHAEGCGACLPGDERGQAWHLADHAVVVALARAEDPRGAASSGPAPSPAW